MQILLWLLLFVTNHSFPRLQQVGFTIIMCPPTESGFKGHMNNTLSHCIPWSRTLAKSLVSVEFAHYKVQGKLISRDFSSRPRLRVGAGALALALRGVSPYCVRRYDSPYQNSHSRHGANPRRGGFGG